MSEQQITKLFSRCERKRHHSGVKKNTSQVILSEEVEILSDKKRSSSEEILSGESLCGENQLERDNNILSGKQNSVKIKVNLSLKALWSLFDCFWALGVKKFDLPSLKLDLGEDFGDRRPDQAFGLTFETVGKGLRAFQPHNTLYIMSVCLVEDFKFEIMSLEDHLKLGRFDGTSKMDFEVFKTRFLAHAVLRDGLD